MLLILKNQADVLFLTVCNKWIRFNEQIFALPSGKSASALEMDIEYLNIL